MSSWGITDQGQLEEFPSTLPELVMTLLKLFLLHREALGNLRQLEPAKLSHDSGV